MPLKNDSLRLSDVEMMTDFEYDVLERQVDMGLTADEFWEWYFSNEEEMGTWTITDKYGKRLKQTSDRAETISFANMTPNVTIEFASNIDTYKEGHFDLTAMTARGIDNGTAEGSSD